jgi:hypothetical protein
MQGDGALYLSEEQSVDSGRNSVLTLYISLFVEVLRSWYEVSSCILQPSGYP